MTRFENGNSGGRNRAAAQSKKGSARGGILVAALFIFVAAVYLLYSLVRIMAMDHDDYAREAASQHFRQIVDYPERGRIVDRSGVVLAMNNYVYTIGITPLSLNTIPAGRLPRAEIVSGMASILGLDEDWLAEQASFLDKPYVLLKKDVQRSEYDKLRDFLILHQIGGVSIDAEMDRYYPENDLASTIIGFTNKREDMIAGVIGLESYYNDVLAGTPGYTYAEVDNYSNAELPYTVPTVEKAVDGHDLVLNIDKGIQRILQQELDRHVDIFRMTRGAVGIVMDPHTGAVLAMGQSGQFDLNDPFGIPAGFEGSSWNPSEFEGETWNPHEDKDHLDYLTSKVWLNRAVSEPYEPGSTYKSLTAAMAIDQVSVNPNQKFSDDPLYVDGWNEYPISCSVRGGHGMRTMEEGLWTSCNPVYVQVAQSLGVDTFYRYVHALGHYHVTGIDLPAEVAGQQQSNPVLIDMAVNSFGEQATVTPIQMLNAYTALGNGGILYRPQIVDKIVDRNGSVVRDIQPEPIRRVFSEETSKIIMDYMRGVVTEGGGLTAEVAGYHSAGKTSTSTSGENEERIVISFANLVPYENPEIAVLTILYEPSQKLLSWPSQLLNRNVTERTLEYMGVPRNYTMAELENAFHRTPVRNLIGSTVELSVQNSPIVHWNIVVEEGASYEDVVTAQYPPPTDAANSYGTIYVSVSGEIPEDMVSVPDFTGLNFDEARDLAEESGLNVRLQGTHYRGTVSSQEIPATEDVPDGEAGRVQRYTVIPLNFEPAPGASPTPSPIPSPVPSQTPG